MAVRPPELCPQISCSPWIQALRWIHSRSGRKRILGKTIPYWNGRGAAHAAVLSFLQQVFSNFTFSSAYRRPGFNGCFRYKGFRVGHFAVIAAGTGKKPFARRTPAFRRCQIMPPRSSWFHWLRHWIFCRPGLPTMAARWASASIPWMAFATSSALRTSPFINSKRGFSMTSYKASPPNFRLSDDPDVVAFAQSCLTNTDSIYPAPPGNQYLHNAGCLLDRLKFLFIQHPGRLPTTVSPSATSFNYHGPMPIMAFFPIWMFCLTTAPAPMKLPSPTETPA